MGGSLASEATLLLSRVTFSHNIIAILGLDVPFLGVHPHVVTSGVAGLGKSGKPAGENLPLPMDRPTAGSDAKSQSQVSLAESATNLSLTDSQSSDLSKPPSRIPSRTPSPKPKKSTFTQTLTKTVTAIYNNRHDLGGAAPRYLWSHLEYGHILLDPAELKAQYDQLRMTKIFFANFYTTVPRTKEEDKEKLGRVFCSLPSSAARDMDGWIPVEMPVGMDEPTAHSAIFVPQQFPGYYTMVEQVSEKIVTWGSQKAGD
jgi:hypothetical protein